MSEQGLVVLLASCAVLLVSILAVRLTARTRLPALLIYLVIGLAIGEAGLGIRFDDYGLTADLGLVALAIILAEGGITTRWSNVKPALPFAIVLATGGVLVSVGVVASACHFVLGLEWRTAVILGSAVSSTDAAAVFSVLRRLPLQPRVVSALEAESGLNDAPVVVLVVLASSDAWGEASLLEVLGMGVYQLVAGALLGVLLGRLGAQLLARVALPSVGLYPLATIALAVGAFGVASAAQASGFLAVYLSGLVLGNAQLPHRRAVLGFASSLTLLAEAGLFILLGLLASPERLPAVLDEALIVGGVATLLARPLAVVLSAAPFRMPWREQTFLAWTGLRGAVPIVVAVIPVTRGLPAAETILDVVLVLVVIFTALQAPTLPWVGRQLGLTRPAPPADLDVDNAPLAQLSADLLQVSVPEGSRLAGVYVAELRLPPGALVAFIVRDGASVQPDEHTRIRTGDEVLVVAPTAVRRATERRLRAVGRGGRLAGWHGGSSGENG